MFYCAKKFFRRRVKGARIRKSYEKTKRMRPMRAGEKDGRIHQEPKDLFGISFHDLIEQMRSAAPMELAKELGITLGEVRRLKKQMDRR